MRLSIFMLLQQDEIWIDASGNEHQIADMDERYRGNVVRFLQSRIEIMASAFLLGADFGPMPTEGTIAYYDVTAEIEHIVKDILRDPMQWLTRSLLWKALVGDGQGHLSECTVRDPDLREVLGCTCLDWTPEWTLS